MGDWWQEEIVDAGKLALLLCMVAFVVTFVTTRVIVRLIRAGKGPFSDNTVGGVHVHHVVPGLALMVLGGLVALGTAGEGWTAMAGVLFGMGLALVFDEFALVLHLDDVYWEDEGRLSVDLVFVLAGVLLLLVIVGSPFGADTTETESSGRLGLVAYIVLELLLLGVAALKGKLGAAIVGLFILPVAVVAAVRIARPRSPWSRRFYEGSPDKQAKAAQREVAFARRWRSKVEGLKDLVAGTTAPPAAREAESAENADGR